MVEYVPEEVLYKYFTPQRQQDPKACVSFAIAHGIMTQLYIKGVKSFIDANDLRAAQLKFLKKDKMKAIGFDEGFRIFEDGYQGIKIHPPAKVKFEFDRIRRWIWKGYPVFMTTLTNGFLHAVVAVGFGKDFFYVIDSAGGKYKQLDDFSTIEECFITFLPKEK